MDIRVEIVADADMTDDDRLTVGRWSVEMFADDADFRGFSWAKPDWHVMVREGAELVSCLKIMGRVGSVGGQPLRMAGIGDVMTAPEQRGKGYARAAMRAAVEFVCQRLGTEFGVLMCKPALVPFYSRFGWEVVPEPLRFEQAWGKEVSPEVTMVKLCGERRWPDGEIDLHGLPW